jgi:SAM-dependent methyltransferase
MRKKFSTPSFSYRGTELELFADATNWKAYWSAEVRPYIGERVPDVGAGLGATAAVLNHAPCRLWLALEPDPELSRRMRANVLAGRMGDNCEVRVGTIGAVATDESFDTILYIDVLEHIESDHEEVVEAASHLSEGGHFVVLAPAHNWLYSAFDEAIGHFRRYNSTSLRALTPRRLRPERFWYLDSLGILVSLANRLILKQAEASVAQVRLWDRGIVPVSRPVDWLTGYRMGKSVIGVWKAAP